VRQQIAGLALAAVCTFAVGCSTTVDGKALMAVTMVTAGEVTAVDGSQPAVSVESVCVHGDSPGAVQLAAAVRDRLKAVGADIRAFC